MALEGQQHYAVALHDQPEEWIRTVTELLSTGVQCLEESRSDQTIARPLVTANPAVSLVAQPMVLEIRRILVYRNDHQTGPDMTGRPSARLRGDLED